MRRLAALMLGSVLATTATGQDLLAGIEPAVLRGLLLVGDQNLTADTAVPAELTGVRMPRQLRWIGSAERSYSANMMGSMVVGAWRADGPSEAAAKLAVDALVAAGGTLQPANPVIGQGVFVRPDDPPPEQVVCRENKPFTVVASELDGASYVVVQTQRGSNATCGNGMIRPYFMSGPAAAHLPKLQLPVDPATGKSPMFLGGGASGSVSSSSRNSFHIGYMSRDTAANVASYLARQMQTQGWQPDTSWSGETTAGSSWHRAGDGNARLTAVLQVLSGRDGIQTAIMSIGTEQ